MAPRYAAKCALALGVSTPILLVEAISANMDHDEQDAPNSMMLKDEVKAEEEAPLDVDEEAEKEKEQEQAAPQRNFGFLAPEGFLQKMSPGSWFSWGKKNAADEGKTASSTEISCLDAVNGYGGQTLGGPGRLKKLCGGDYNPQGQVPKGEWEQMNSIGKRISRTADVDTTGSWKKSDDLLKQYCCAAPCGCDGECGLDDTIPVLNQ
ncbi:unnamed protein product [Amoebophrya sp. A25]|nr:unnamed protein product [Amoebophrya sp. A25]|eukprot:GSA25T00007938001.1